MGLFSFLKDVGAKIFTGKAAAPKKAAPDMGEMAKEMMNTQRAIALKTAVAKLGIAIENFDIVVADDTAKVYGQAGSQADREKVILAVGNTNGIAYVEDNISVVVEEPAAEFYEVRRGDSLSKIAKRYYGNALKYPVIFKANQPMLKNPNLIYPGQVLRIPNLNA